MKKFTRRAYNRKLIMFAVSIFMAVGMISTGFSAWVMSVNSEVQHDAPVEVGIVTDASMVVTVDQWKKQGQDEAASWDTAEILSFDAVDGATEVESGVLGRIRADSDSEQKLTMLISGKVTNADVLETLTLTIQLPQSLRDAVAKKYIKVKGVADSIAQAGTLTILYDKSESTNNLNYDYDTETKEGTFSYTLEFEWGEFFGGKNPAEFYDTMTDSTRTKEIQPEEEGGEITYEDYAVKGKELADSVMVAEMKEFRETLTGSEDLEAAYEGKIHIKVVASAG